MQPHLATEIKPLCKMHKNVSVLVFSIYQVKSDISHHTETPDIIPVVTHKRWVFLSDTPRKLISATKKFSFNFGGGWVGWGGVVPQGYPRTPELIIFGELVLGTSPQPKSQPLLKWKITPYTGVSF